MHLVLRLYSKLVGIGPLEIKMKRITPPIMKAGSVGKPRFKGPKVKTVLTKKGAMSRAMRALNKRIGTK
jgi:hypothetical protein